MTHAYLCPGCPTSNLVPKQGQRCRDCERRRGGSTARGYGTQHQKLRKLWQDRLLTGPVTCSRCREPIRANDAWDLDHTDNRTSYLGPSHARCNRGFFRQKFSDPRPGLRETHSEAASRGAKESGVPSVG